MNNPQISIIVPVYNTPKEMLEKCVASLISQTGPYEYIFVNDGSTDDTLHAILSEAKEADKRLIYIKKENGGVSAARNDGMKLARGKYLMFVDADDFLLDGALDYAYKKAEALNADAVLFGNNHKEDVIGSVDRILTSTEKEVLKKEVIAFNTVCFDKLGVNIDAPWAKIFKKSIIDDNSIIYPTDIHRSEDAIFDLLCYEHSQIIAVDNKTIYSYEVNPTSICHTCGIREVKMLPSIIEHEYEFINQYHRGSEDYLDALVYRAFKGVMGAAWICLFNESKKHVSEFRTLLKDRFVKPFMSRCSYSMCNNRVEKIMLFLFKNNLIAISKLLYELKPIIKPIVKMYRGVILADHEASSYSLCNHHCQYYNLPAVAAWEERRAA